MLTEEAVKDTKGVIIIRKSKEDRQHNDSYNTRNEAAYSSRSHGFIPFFLCRIHVFPLFSFLGGFLGVSFFVLCLMLHVSLDCAFLIIPPAFSNVYLINSLISRQQVHWFIVHFAIRLSFTIFLDSKVNDFVSIQSVILKTL
jgi:hypothetical protein